MPKFKVNKYGYDKIPEIKGSEYDYRDINYFEDKDFCEWYTNSNLPVNLMWIAFIAWREKEERLKNDK